MPRLKEAPQSGIRFPAAGVAAVVVAALLLVLALGYWSSSLRSKVIFDGQSAFGRVWVMERADGLRSLYTGEGRARQSAVFPARPKHLEIAYTRVAAVGLAFTPPDGRILFVGLGGGAMPMYARQVLPKAQIDVVEIDPLIVDIAPRYFGFRPDSHLMVHTSDGRAFIEQAQAESYDLIVLDAFSDDEIPFALATRQFLETVRSRLTPRGMVVSNLWSSNGAYESMLATYAAVFDQAHLVHVGRGTQRILVAGSALRPLDRHALVEASRMLAREVDLGFDLPELVRRGYEGQPSAGAPALVDRPNTPSVSPR